MEEKFLLQNVETNNQFKELSIQCLNYGKLYNCEVYYTHIKIKDLVNSKNFSKLFTNSVFDSIVKVQIAHAGGIKTQEYIYPLGYSLNEDEYKKNFNKSIIFNFTKFYDFIYNFTGKFIFPLYISHDSSHSIKLHPGVFRQAILNFLSKKYPDSSVTLVYTLFEKNHEYFDKINEFSWKPVLNNIDDCFDYDEISKILPNGPLQFKMNNIDGFNVTQNHDVHLSKSSTPWKIRFDQDYSIFINDKPVAVCQNNIYSPPYSVLEHL